MDYDLENTATLYINGKPVSELFVDGKLVWKGQWSPYSNQYIIDTTQTQVSPDASLIVKGGTSEEQTNKMFTNPLNRAVNANDLIFTGEIGAGDVVTGDVISIIKSDGLTTQLVRGNGGWGRTIQIKVGHRIKTEWHTDSPYADIPANASFWYHRRVPSPMMIEFPTE